MPRKKQPTPASKKANLITDKVIKPQEKRAFCESSYMNKSQETFGVTSTKKKGLVAASEKVNTMSGKVEKPGGKRVFGKVSPVKNNEETLGVYEFTFDPKDEPTPQKKTKKKRIPKKKDIPNVFWDSNYDKKVSKKINELRKLVLTKNKLHVNQANIEREANKKFIPEKENCEQNKPNIASSIVQSEDLHTQTSEDVLPPLTEPATIQESIFTENVAEITSPVSIPKRPQEIAPKQINTPRISVSSDISFFSAPPVANSSFNTSNSPVNNSPWRLDIDVCTKKWPTNIYVKQDMTPAYDSSFAEVEFNPNKLNVSKNKYAPMLMSTTPEKSGGCLFTDFSTFNNQESKLKQPSIISYIQQKMHKSDKKSSSKKKKTLDNVTPVKENSMFNDSYNTSIERSPVAKKIRAATIRSLNFDNSTLETVIQKENNNNESRNTKKTNKSERFFGFDDSDVADRENISPDKNVNKQRFGRKTRMQTRKALMEVNEINKPMRVNILQPPVVRIEKLFEEVSVNKGENIINATETKQNDEDETDNPEELGLFEDLECIHHHQKPERRSYSGKPHRYREASVSSESDDYDTDASEKDKAFENMEDFTFTDIEKKTRKTRTKNRRNILSKKEKEEADKWAKSFTSMLKEVDEFPLTVE